jgi:aminopeptidase S
VISLPTGGNLTLSFSYYLAHLNNSSSSDFFRVSVVGNTTAVVLEEFGTRNSDEAIWGSFNVNLNNFAGQTIYILIEAADAGGGSLVEAGVDDVRITNN